MTIYRLNLDPIPCPRPRAAKRGAHAQVYYPKEYQVWKDAAVEQLNKLPKPPAYNLIRVSCHFEREQPKTTKLLVPRGDVDNYAKSLLDAITSAKWWGDDNQVVHLVASKSWAPKGSPGLIRFTITEEVP